MKLFMVLFLGLLVFVRDVWAPPPDFDSSYDYEAEERWDEYGTNDDGTWWGITNGVRYDGVTVCSSQEQLGSYEMRDEISLDKGGYCWCKITSPFDGKYVYFYNYIHHAHADALCNQFCRCGEEIMTCPSGVFCGADTIMELHNALLNSQKEKPAACYLKTSTGLSLPLYDVKSTSPALHVLRDGVVYYGNMELGQGTNTLNVNYNGAMYHLVK